MEDGEDKSLQQAMRMVIDHLDAQMEEAPNRELADVSNYLEKELAKLKEA